jgi:hypothetical protein
MAHHIHLHTTQRWRLLLLRLLLLLLLVGSALLHVYSTTPCCSWSQHSSANGSSHSPAATIDCCCCCGTHTTRQCVGQGGGGGRGHVVSVSWRLHAYADARHVLQLEQRHDLAVEAAQVVDDALHTCHTQSGTAHAARTAMDTFVDHALHSK